MHNGDIATAIRIAAEVHEGQFDKGGECYILHPLAVMRMAGEMCGGLRWTRPGFIEDVQMIAVMHDVIEDFEGKPGEAIRFVQMLKDTFEAQVIAGVLALTKQDGQSYDDYILQVAENPHARIVKICDLKHNMDTGRLPEGDIGEKDFARWDKYRRALVFLERGTR